MIYELLYSLRNEASFLNWLNVVRYIPFRVIAATITAMFMAFFLAPWFIRELQRKQIGQVVRSDGPESHKVKAGTPTMGGALILLCMLVPTVLWCDLTNPLVHVTMAVTVAYGLIGYLDDYLKLQKKHSGGLPARYKLLGQALIAAIAIGVVFIWDDGMPPDWVEIRTRLSVPFVAFNKYPIELPLWVYVPFAVFVVVAWSNAVNLTDGLDGLAIGPVLINATVYLFLSYAAGALFFGFSLARYLDIPPLQSAPELAVYCGAMVGAGTGFLWYNTYPAQVFMGDVGALALGGGLGMLAVLTKNELLSVIFGGVMVIESVSVVAQVAIFRLTGKRVFLMAPIHHHFEKKGWPEPRVIVRFWIISVLLALVSMLTLKVR
ncbi:MAG: phospho-N-acetylmuramoyl-pentapeptide-transferase [Polyangiaceae bacterium]|nr:phospho-N-acetylmuramoyl-pentapeptide-transferase [Polyangiaceae bacterium]